VTFAHAIYVKQILTKYCIKVCVNVLHYFHQTFPTTSVSVSLFQLSILSQACRNVTYYQFIPDVLLTLSTINKDSK